MTEFSDFSTLSSCDLMKFGEFVVSLTSFGPWQSHLGPPSAPSLSKVAIFDDTWCHFGVILELMFGTVGVFFDACRSQELKKEGSGSHSESETFFHRFWGLPPMRSGGFSLQRERCFHFGGQWQIMATLGSILESFWEPKPQLPSLWGLPESILGSKMGCRFKGDFLRISRGRQGDQLFFDEYDPEALQKIIDTQHQVVQHQKTGRDKKALPDSHRRG